MRHITYLIIWLLLPAWLSAQTNITQAEYWYDGDFGTANRQTVSGTSVNYTELLGVSSLDPGLHTFTIRFQDTRGVWGSVLTRFFTYYPNSSTGIHLVTDVEYWFDGNYSSAIETSLTSGTSVDWNSLLNVNALNNGLHTVSFRFKDDRGIWGAPKTSFFKKESNTGLQQIVALEYWLNNDYANKTSRSFSPTSLLNFNEMIDVSSLDIGFHFVNFRLKDESGQWGPASSWYFTKENEATTTELHPISEMEYWFDGNYSTVQTDPISTTSTLNLDTDLNVSDLTDGLHYVSTRFKDEAGNWSPAFSSLFVKLPPDPEAELHNLQTAEYWIDGDISGVVKTDLTPGAEYALNIQLDVSDLNDGLHTLTYRFQDEAGKWSPGYSVFFSKYQGEIVTINNKITSYRYWSDDQIGSAVEISLSTPVKSYTLDELIDVSALPGGTNDITFQFKDSQGQWSSAISQTYQKEVHPSVQISSSATSICTGSQIEFSAVIFDANEIEWSFGDNSYSTETNPVHRYAEPGIYQVSAIVTHTDSMKSAYDTITGGIEVNPAYNIWLGETDTIFYDSFEEETTGTAPSEWTLKYNGSGIANQVVVESPVKNGIKAFQMEGVYMGASEFYKRFTNLPDEVTLEAWANCEKTLSGLAGSIGLGNFSIGTWGTRTSRLEFNNGKFVATYTGGSSYEIMPYSPGTWYHIRMVHDLENLTYRVYINNVLMTGNDGTTTTSDFPMHPTIATQDIMLAAGNSGINKMYFDDILLSHQGTLQVCESNLPFVLGLQNISTEGTYTETFNSQDGCDSTVSVHLEIIPSGSTTLYDTVCESDLPYVFGSQNLISTGTYTETIQNNTECSNSVTLNLLVKDSSMVYTAKTICESELPLEFGIQTLIAAGTYTEVFPAQNGCDSTVMLTLDVLDTSLVTEELEICESLLPFTFGKQSLNVGGVYTEVFHKTNGCDSTVILTLVVHPEYNLNFKDSVCEGDLPYAFANLSISAAGNYSDTLQTVQGCDSIVSLDLVVYPEYTLNIKDSVCEGDLPYAFASLSISAAGHYADTLQTVQGCDSIVSLDLVVHQEYSSNLKDSVCENELPYSFESLTINAAGHFEDTLQTVYGCDSIITLDLFVHPELGINIKDTVCESDLPYSFGGLTITASGEYADTLVSGYGCDSIVILSLTVNDTFRIADTVSVCRNDLPYSFGAQYLETDGTYTELFPSSEGCDSTVVLVFTVSDTFSSAFSDTICENDLPYEFGSQMLTASGNYTEIFSAENGCDSVVTLNLRVNPAYQSDLNLTVKKSSLPYKFNSQELTKAGNYTQSLSSVFGCDSVITLHLKVEDDIPPNVKCNTIEVLLSDEGKYTLNAGDLAAIAKGSSDDVTAFEALTIAVTPSVFTCENIGETNISLQVSDAAGNKNSCQTTIRVLDAVHNPQIDSVSNQFVDEDSSLQLKLSGIAGGTQCEEREVTVSAAYKNQNLIDSLTVLYEPFSHEALLNIVPVAQKYGTDSITVTVEDLLGNSISISFLLTVNAVNDAPVILQAIADQSMKAKDSASIFISKIPGVFFEDIDDSTLFFNFNVGESGLPNWITVTEEPEQFAITFTPTAADTGCFEVTISLMDEAGASVSDIFELCVNPIIVGINPISDNVFELLLYPNPTKGMVNIDLQNPPPGDLDLVVLDIAGAEVLRKSYRKNERILFDLSDQVSGTYLIVIKIDDKRIVRKLILDKK